MTGTGTGGWRLLCLAGAPSGGVRAEGKAGRCGGLRVRVCRGLRRRRAGGGGPPTPAAGPGGEPGLCQWPGGTRGSSSALPEAGELLEAEGRFVVPVPAAPLRRGRGARGFWGEVRGKL